MILVNLEIIKNKADEFVRQLTDITLDYKISHRDVCYYGLNESPAIAVTNFERHNGIIKIHFGHHFDLLDLETKIDIIKHEVCHVVDVGLNGLTRVLEQDKTGHGKTFNSLCDKIGCKYRYYVDYKVPEKRPIKRRRGSYFIVEKRERVDYALQKW